MAGMTSLPAGGFALRHRGGRCRLPGSEPRQQPIRSVGAENRVDDSASAHEHREGDGQLVETEGEEEDGQRAANEGGCQRQDQKAQASPIKDLNRTPQADEHAEYLDPDAKEVRDVAETKALQVDR